MLGTLTLMSYKRVYLPQFQSVTSVILGLSFQHMNAVAHVKSHWLDLETFLPLANAYSPNPIFAFVLLITLVSDEMYGIQYYWIKCF